MRFRLASAALALLFTLLPTGPALAAGAQPPGLMLASHYRAGAEVSEYWVSEKLDGVRGRWDGRRLWTRGGQPVTPPSWFTAGWPAVPMDGELWMDRGRFETASTLVRLGGADDPAWKRMRFMVFDLPAHAGAFEARGLAMRSLLNDPRRPWLRPVPQFRVADPAQLDARLRQVVDAGGEGLMLHRRDALYRLGRSDDLLKYKPHDDAEARVVAHTASKGRFEGMLGALVVELPDGRRMRLGTGFSDAQRADPPPPGTIVTYRYNGLTSTGLPRFARFLRVRHEPAPPDPR
jgi:DNA ligase-1